MNGCVTEEPIDHCGAAGFSGDEFIQGIAFKAKLGFQKLFVFGRNRSGEFDGGGTAFDEVWRIWICCRPIRIGNAPGLGFRVLNIAEIMPDEMICSTII